MFQIETWNATSLLSRKVWYIFIEIATDHTIFSFKQKMVYRKIWHIADGLAFDMPHMILKICGISEDGLEIAIR